MEGGDRDGGREHGWKERRWMEGGKREREGGKRDGGRQEGWREGRGGREDEGGGTGPHHYASFCILTSFSLCGPVVVPSCRVLVVVLSAIAVIIIHEPWLIFQQAPCMSQVNIPGWDICHHTQSILGDDYYTCHCARRVPPWCLPSIGIIRQHPNLPHRRARRCPSYFLIWKALHFVCSMKSGTVHTLGAFPTLLPHCRLIVVVVDDDLRTIS